jgi:hypothetical protein
VSALGQKQTCAAQKVMSALPLKADMCGAKVNIRFVPIADIEIKCAARLSMAVRLMPMRQTHLYSITSSVRASRLFDGLMPSTLAVLRLMMSSNLVAFWTGRSPGFSPLSMRST